MALPWLIGAAVVAVGAAIAASSDSSSSSSSNEREERECREREIERENERRREEARRREREEAERQRLAKIQAKQEYAKSTARSLFEQHNLRNADSERMAYLTLELGNDYAKTYAMHQWNNTFSIDNELSEFENRRQALNQLQRQLKG